MKISEEIKEKIRRGVLATVRIRASYFATGDYTEWHENSDHARMEYRKWIRKYLIPEMEEYDRLELDSRGVLYGIRNGICHDISDDEISSLNPLQHIPDKEGIEIFLDIAEESGISLELGEDDEDEE